jgi:hypothetical protein
LLNATIWSSRRGTFICSSASRSVISPYAGKPCVVSRRSTTGGESPVYDAG